MNHLVKCPRCSKWYLDTLRSDAVTTDEFNHTIYKHSALDEDIYACHHCNEDLTASLHICREKRKDGTR